MCIFAISIRRQLLIPDKRHLKTIKYNKLFCSEKGFGRFLGTTLEFCFRYIFMAKKATIKKEDVLNLDNILFKCRDILRQAKNSGSFFEKRDIMLTLVFLRFLGEKYEDGVVNLRKKLIEEGLDPDNEDIQKAFFDDPTFADGTFNLMPEARWSAIINTPAPQLNATLDNALKSISSTTPELKGCFVEGTFTQRNLGANDIKKIVDEVNKINHKTFGEEKDLIGRVYEYFLKEFAENATKEEGEFYTPHDVVQLIATVIEPFDGTLSAGYTLGYNYNTATGRKFQMSSVTDVNYRVASATVSNSDKINERHTYEYDKNGNITYVSTARKRGDRAYRDRTREEKFRWDEANRLLAISQDGYVSHYFYDASGERTVKMHGGNSAVFVNSQMSGRETGALSFSAYFNPYFSIHDGTRFTKHLYIGSERIASMTGELDEDYYDVANNNNIVHAGVEVYVNNNDLHIPYNNRCYAMRDSIDGNYSYFGLHSGLDWSGVQLRALSLPCHEGEEGDVSNGDGSTPRSQGSGTGNEYPSRYGSIWYFHKDHLGSSTLITDGTGSISQQVEYLPYGEVFLEKQHSSDPNQPLYATPYKFNGKELDEETGLYYYGARYMNPRLSKWYATDPMQEKYPNISSYAYCAGNPVRFTDMSGMKFEDEESKQYGTILKGALVSRKDEINKSIDKEQKNLNKLQNSKKINQKKIDRSNEKIIELKEQLKYIEDAISYIDVMADENNNTVFSFTQLKNTQVGYTQIENGVIKMSVVDFSNASHELIHGIDIFNNNCEMLVENKLLSSEIKAYKTQYSFNKNSLPSSDLSKIKKVSDIDLKWLYGIKVSGVYYYIIEINPILKNKEPTVKYIHDILKKQ